MARNESTGTIDGLAGRFSRRLGRRRLLGLSAKVSVAAIGAAAGAKIVVNDASASAPYDCGGCAHGYFFQEYSCCQSVHTSECLAMGSNYKWEQGAQFWCYKENPAEGYSPCSPCLWYENWSCTPSCI